MTTRTTRSWTGVVLALALASGGCIFSSDDDTPAPVSGWQPELWITPDSVSVFFPNEWPDTTTFVWNQFSSGLHEYVMEAVIPVGPVDIHLAFFRDSDGGAKQSGSFSEMAADAYGSYWLTNRVTGEIVNGPPLALNAVSVLKNGVWLRAWWPVASYLYGNPWRAPHFWTATFVRRGLFAFREVRRNAIYVPDRSQEGVRKVDGALDADDYVVMNLVLKRFMLRFWPSTVVAPRTIVVPKPPPNSPFDFIDQDITALRPDTDTRAAFDVVRLKKLDTSALSQLGYTIREPDHPPVANTLYIWISGIGYNHARTEALLYASTYCGGLCGEGDLFLLQKVGGYWVIKYSLTVWIS